MFNIGKGLMIVGSVIVIVFSSIAYFVGLNTDNRECIKYSQANGECVEYK